MNGLYQRALEVYRKGKGLHLVSKEDGKGDIEDIPSEERENILREIDSLLKQNKIGTETPRLKGGKSGIALPFLVNLFIVASVGGAILLYTLSSRGEETRLVAESRTVTGAESQLVEALKRESAAQIGQKDQAITTFREKLAEATVERERLGAQVVETIRKREQELASEMASALEAERGRLRAAGMGSDAAEDRLKSFEERLKAESARQIEDYQKKARDEAAEGAAAVDRLITEYRQSLSQAQDERSRLLQQYQSRETDLKRQNALEVKAVQEEKAKAMAELERIQEQRRQEELVEERIIASYNEIGSRIASGGYTEALESIGKLRDSLDAEPARSLEAVQKRRPVELFMLGSLDELIRNRIERNSVSAAALVETKVRIDSARGKFAQADLAFQKKEYAKARELYLSALSEIPEARTSHERLQEMALKERETQLAASHEAELRTERSARLESERQARIEAQTAAERLSETEAEYASELKAERSARLESERQARIEAQAAAKRLSETEAEYASELKSERMARLESERQSRFEAQTAEQKTAELESRLARELEAGREARLEAGSAYERIAAREALLSSGQESIADGNALMRDRAWQAALDQYGKALGILLSDEEAAAFVIDQAALAGYRLETEKDSAQRAALPDSIARMRRDLSEALVVTPPPEGGSSAREIASLLRAKLLLWQIIGTDPVKSAHPELYDTMQTYFETFASQQRQAGREAALLDLLSLVDSIGESKAKTVLPNAPESEHDIVLRLLSALERMTRDQAAPVIRQ